MRTRLKKYADYGFTLNEEKALKQYIKSPEFDQNDLLKECCEHSNEGLSELIYKSLVKGMSYDSFDCIFITSDDFYGYQRKALSLFRESLIEKGSYSTGIMINGEIWLWGRKGTDHIKDISVNYA